MGASVRRVTPDRVVPLLRAYGDALLVGDLAIGQFAHNHATAMTVSTGPKIGVNAGGRARRYSGRSVTAGSTNAARRAGKRHAASAPARIIVMTVA